MRTNDMSFYLSLVEVEEGVSQDALVAPFVVTFQDVVNKGDNAEPGIFN